MMTPPMNLHSYRMYMGAEEFEKWRFLLRAPGGGPLAALRREGRCLVRADYESPGDFRASLSRRWRRAQKAEADHWRTWRKKGLEKDVSLVDFFGDVLAKTGGPPPGRVLDVGCGPVSVFNFHRAEGAEPIGIDPLGVTYAEEELMEWDAHTAARPIPIIGLPAEKLPFPDDTFDHVVCFNALDHVSDPPAVLREMRRVLRTGGTLRVWVNTFASWIKRFLFFDTPHPWHCDHREFRRLAQQAGFHVVHELAEPMTIDLPASLPGKLRYFHYWIATWFVCASYFQFSRRDGAT